MKGFRNPKTLSRLQAKAKKNDAKNDSSSVQTFELKGDNFAIRGPIDSRMVGLEPELIQKIKAQQNSPSVVSTLMQAPKLSEPAFYENLDKEVDALQLEIDAKISLEKANALKNILQISVARIHYNRTIMDFVDNASQASLIDFLRDQLNANYPDNPVGDQDIERRAFKLKNQNQYSIGAANDLVKYEEIIQIIKTGYPKPVPSVFDEIFDWMEGKLIGDVENSKSAGKMSLEQSRFLGSDFYREGLEIPHEQQILEIARSFKSEIYKTYQAYFHFELIQNPSGSGFLVLTVANPGTEVVDFFQKIIEEFEGHEDEVNAFLGSSSLELKASKKWRAAESAARELLSLKKTAKILVTRLTEEDVRQVQRPEFTRWYLLKEDINKKYRNWKKSYDKFVAEQHQKEAKPVVKAKPVQFADNAPPAESSQDTVAASTIASSSASSVSSALAESSATIMSIASSSIALYSSLSSLTTSLSEEPSSRRLSYSSGLGRKGSKELLFSFEDRPRRKSMLGSTNRQVLEDVFDDKLKDHSLTFDAIDNLIKALGGKKIQ